MLNFKTSKLVKTFIIIKITTLFTWTLVFWRFCDWVEKVNSNLVEKAEFNLT